MTEKTSHASISFSETDNLRFKFAQSEGYWKQSYSYMQIQSTIKAFGKRCIRGKKEFHCQYFNHNNVFQCHAANKYMTLMKFIYVGGKWKQADVKSPRALNRCCIINPVSITFYTCRSRITIIIQLGGLSSKSPLLKPQPPAWWRNRACSVKSEG